MAKNKEGKIINIGSDLSVIAPNQNLYSDYKNFKPVTYSVVKHGLLELQNILLLCILKIMFK